MSGGGGPGRRPEVLPRDRLLQVLRRRHRLRLVLVEAPAGFGRTTLLRQAVDEGAARRRDCDLVAAPDALADAVAEAGRIVDAEPDRHVAVIVDDAHRAADADRLGEIVDALPEGVHLVVSARLGRLRAAARLASMGGVVRLDGGDLAYTPDEVAALGGDGDLADPELATWPAVASLFASGCDDLVVPYARSEVVEELGPPAVQLLSALAAVGGGGPGLVDALLDAVDADVATRAELLAVPLVAWTADGCWPHPVWSQATLGFLDETLHRQALRLAVEDRLARRSPAEAGALAVHGGDGDALRQVVRAALATQPALVPGAVLQDWLHADLLPTGSPERSWLSGVVNGQRGHDRPAIEQLEAARAAYERTGDAGSEGRVLMALGTLARRTDDFALLGALIARSGQLDGGDDLLGLQAIATAVAAQIRGDGKEAISILEGVPEGSLAGDWAAQVHMILATNLAFAGREDDAVDSFTRATGLGSTASQAVAHDLLASALWTAGRLDLALDAAEQAEVLAVQAEVPVTLDLAMAARACLLALVDHDDAAPQLDRVARRDPTDGEAVALAGVARAVAAVQAGDPEGATRELAALPPAPARPTRSKLWRAALESALLPDAAGAVWASEAERDHSLRRAVAAGVAGQAHLADGHEVPPSAQPYLPSCWWPGAQVVVHLRFLGGASVERARRPTDAAGWQRGRVRELALHLAVRRTVGRDAVAAALWPDLDASKASRNLRVTLSHLLDVLDPDRERGQGSEVLVDTAGRLHLAELPWLRVDVVELERTAEDLVASASVGDRSGALAAARRLLRFSAGPLLGGAVAGEWLDPVRRRLDDLVLRAAATGAELALEAGEAELAADLGRRMVTLDPWAERAHAVIVTAHLAMGDFDVARRAVRETLRMLNTLGVDPQPETLELAHRAGWRPGAGAHATPDLG